jgi:hypothetical protein
MWGTFSEEVIYLLGLQFIDELMVKLVVVEDVEKEDEEHGDGDSEVDGEEDDDGKLDGSVGSADDAEEGLDGREEHHNREG